MLIVIPLGGIGKRFRENGYIASKALINVLGKPILFHLLDNLNYDLIDEIIIPYNHEYSNLEDLVLNNYPQLKFRFIRLEEQTSGAADTLFRGIEDIDSNNPFLALDSDNFYTDDILSKINLNSNSVLTFTDVSDSSIYSYVEIDNNNHKIINIKEKEKISSHACSGGYFFSSINKTKRFMKRFLSTTQSSEHYTSGLIKYMIDAGEEFNTIEINKDKWHCLGTPFQVKQFCNNYPLHSSLNGHKMIKTLTICFASGIIQPKILEYIAYLKRFNHKIILFGELIPEFRLFDLCVESLNRIDYDIFINTSFDSFSQLEKYLGFYMDSIDPRSFNSLELSSLQTIIKKSDDLSGEIYYYTHIPYQLKDLFPIFVMHNPENTMYVMEKINGVTLTSLYLSELLTPEILINVMKSIDRIHKTRLENKPEINIYSNGSLKLIRRYSEYDYSRFPDSDRVYHKLLEGLYEYEINKKGHKTIIHGDTVFTNIIINEFGKIKFIDMRGKVGDDYSIYGDEMYDWAKLYQSILGYDKILQNIDISKEYENKIKEVFEHFFVNMFSKNKLKDLKLLTNSLLFTLIPLHDNDKCTKYYELISF